MAKVKLEDLPSETLHKRKKMSQRLFWMMLIIGVIGLIVLIINAFAYNSIKYSLIPGPLTCLMFTIILYDGTKKLNAEIIRRENTHTSDNS